MSTFTSSLVRIAVAEIGVHEEPRNSNRGPRVDTYKAATWLDPKQAWAWCAAFICWTVQEAMKETGVKETKTFKRPRTAGAWDFINWSLEQDNTTKTLRAVQAKDIQAGDIIVYRASHIGLAITPTYRDGFDAVEGNTDSRGSREGGGVYRKNRTLSEVRARIRFTI